MARFRPFRAVRFAPERIGSFASVVAPPYDVISVERRDELIAASPFNVTHLILNPQGHDRAAELYRAWRSEGVLVRDPSPAFYIYRQEFEWHGLRARTGIIGALHLEPFSTGVVRPHEHTFAHHKKDRLELTKRVQANLSAIFGLYSNPEFDPQPEGGWDQPAEIDVVHDGVRHRLWSLRSAEALRSITDAVAGRTVFLADGHHRYETALNYYELLHPDRPLAREDGPDDEACPEAHVLMFLARFEDPGMLILPTHRELVDLQGADVERFIEELSKRFSVERIGRSEQGRRKLLAALEEDRPESNLFGVALRGVDSYLLVERPVARTEGTSVVSRLDVSVLHDEILGACFAAAGGGEPKLEYAPSAERILDRVDDGLSAGAFLLRPTRAQQMAEACMAGELMPHKSTYFYPKLLTGLVFHSLTGE